MLTNKTIDATPNSLNISTDENRWFKLEPVQPLSISEINYILNKLKELNEKFVFRILWD
jgi:hypothetical protein